MTEYLFALIGIPVIVIGSAWVCGAPGFDLMIISIASVMSSWGSAAFMWIHEVMT